MAIEHVSKRPLGHFPLVGGESVGLEPRTCGELKVGAGAIGIGRNVLKPGERLRLWRGDRAQLVNRERGTAYFAWDVCMRQPSRMDRARRLFKRLSRMLALRA